MAYLQLLNRFFHNENVDIRFSPYNAHGGRVANIKECAQIIRRQQRSIKNIFSLLDLDIYYRGDDDFSQLPDNVTYLFNTWNFEDFLVLHCNPSIISRWHTSSCGCGHITSPQHSNQTVERLKREIFPHYVKGKLPYDEIDWGMLYNIFSNNGKHRHYLASDFAYFLKCLLLSYYSKSQS